MIARMIHESSRSQPQLFTIFVMEYGKVVFANNYKIFFVFFVEMGYRAKETTDFFTSFPILCCDDLCSSFGSEPAFDNLKS